MYANPDQLCALGGYIEREYGPFGYHVSEIVNGPGIFALLATVRHADGSEFKVHVDRYGNAVTVPEQVLA